MKLRLPVAECGKCGALAPAVEWRESALGVSYLVDSATGAEHARTCGGVSPRVVSAPVRPAAIAEPVRVSVSGYTPRRDLAPERVPGGVLMRGVGGARVFVPDAPARESEPAQLVAEPDGEPDGEPVDFDADALAAELEYADAMREVEAHNARRGATGAEWPELRRVILAGGGLGPSADWPRDYYPADLYRVHGKPPDIAAVETTLGASDTPPWGAGPDIGDAAMFDYLHRSWAEWQRIQEARRPRPRKVAATPAQALAEPARPSDPMRSATLNLARLVADVADLVADGRAPRQLARSLADAARMLAEAQQ